MSYAGFLESRGQGSIEYLLLVGGAILVAAIVLALINQQVFTGTSTVDARASEALCITITSADCGSKDPDRSGPLATTNCILQGGLCTYKSTADWCAELQAPKTCADDPDGGTTGDGSLEAGACTGTVPDCIPAP